MKKFKTEITVQLVGGLGNQLFGYYAGLAVADHRHFQIKFDVSQFDKGFSAHGSSIQSFNLKHEFVSLRQETQILNRVIRVGKSSRFAPGFLKKLANNLMPEFTSNVDGFESKVFEIEPGSLVRGYFQSYKYLEQLRDSERFDPPTLKKESEWFKEMSALSNTEDPVCLHLRRGDYRLLSEEFGLLSSGYYLESLRYLKERLNDGFCIWVFSDDPAAAKVELEPVFDQIGGLKGIRWIEPPLGTDAAESLVLMSRARANVISNSTFAWWGAALNRRSAPVIAPRKWFRGKEDPDMLYPSGWALIDSTWL